MKIKLSRLKEPIRALVERTGREADRHRVPVYLVGGFVRDMILGRKNFDLDIVVEAPAIPFARKLAQIFKAHLTVHEQFKTAKLILPAGDRIDLATAREEIYPTPGALPVVKPGHIRSDLFRRDFTINALAVRINKDHWEDLVDPLGGLQDLQDKKIKVMHQKSFVDDPTRILRAVRFEQRLNYQMEPQTRESLARAIQNKAYRDVNIQRYFAEFKKILMEDSPARALKRLNEFNGLEFIHPTFKWNDEIANNFIRIGNTFLTFEKRLDGERSADPWLVYFMALLEDLRPSHGEAVLKRFNLKKEDQVKVLRGRSVRALAADVCERRLPRSQVFEMLIPLSLENIVYLYALVLKKTARKRIECFITKDRRVTIDLDGNDLMALGIPKGKSVGALLHEILLNKIDGNIRTKQDEIKWVRSSIQREAMINHGSNR